MALTKTHIIDRVNELGYTKRDSIEIIETLLEIIKSTLANSGEDILVSGFGKFQVKEKSPRRGRNLVTGEEIFLDARKVVTFKCSGKLRARINEHNK